MSAPRDHGGGLDAAMAEYGGTRADWLDLSTGINPVPYPIGDISPHAWSVLPDSRGQDRLIRAARSFWNVPDSAALIAAPGASALITHLPDLSWAGRVAIARPTYNEFAAAYRLHGQLYEDEADAPVRIFAHPNNPDGQLWDRSVIWGDHRELTIVDESFCDTCPRESHVGDTSEPGILVLKSFGKFWGLAGLRLGFAIGTPHTLARPGTGSDTVIDLAELLGPWPVSGPALEIGARALEDRDWAIAARRRLKKDAARLDRLIASTGAKIIGGTTLFRLYGVDDAAAWQARLAQHHIWSRIFPYSRTWLRLGLPHPDRWDQLETALETAPWS